MRYPKGKGLLRCMAVVAFSVCAAVILALRTPMTVCLTFDDDQNAHATVAGPTLEKYGWRGSFNIVTGRLEHPRAKGKMTWAQAEELLSHGHDIFPHSYFPDPESKTFSHYNLKDLADSGNMKEVERQIVGSKQMIETRLGVSPSVFCLPFNALNKQIAEVIKRHGMKPMNCCRRNFPTHPGLKPMSVSEYLKTEWMRGVVHRDLMIHGIIRAEGGWEPFEDAEHFARFCAELKEIEDSGIIKIVRYGDWHVNSGRQMWARALGHVRKILFRVLRFVGLI